MGISGRIAQFFLGSRLTPLIAICALLAGAFAVVVMPREEEPQINVTMANVLIPFPGASAKDVETLVAIPAEQVIGQIHGLEHVFSVSKPGLAIVTAQFKVGVPRTEALVRLHDTINANRDWLPKELGVGEPLVKPKGIDDVPIVTLTLWTDDNERGAFEVERVAHALEAELKRVPGTREVTTIGGPGRAIRVLLEPERLAAFKLTAADIRHALLAANSCDALGLAQRGQPDHRRRVRGIPGERAGRARACGRRGGRQPRLPRRRGAHRRRPAATRALCLARHRPGGEAQGDRNGRRVSGGHDRRHQEARRERGRGGRSAARARGRAREHRDPRRHRGHGDAQLRRDGQRQGDEAHRQARLRHAVGGSARLRRARAARGGHRRRGGDPHALGHALRLVGVGVHAQPRVALRAHLLDRHPGRRRDRRRREHPSPSRARTRRAARLAHPEGGRRGGRADDRRHPYRHRGAAADGVHLGARRDRT